jgi:hypothetical protein
MYQEKNKPLKTNLFILIVEAFAKAFKIIQQKLRSTRLSIFRGEGLPPPCRGPEKRP